jgi:prevent-host-death family protein
MNVRQISISEFKAHCTEEIREVEKGDLILELTRHGRTVAVVQPSYAAPSAPTLEDWVGSGKGTVRFGPHYDPAEPAFDPGDWDS